MKFREFEQSLIGRPNTVKTQISLFRNWVKPYAEDGWCKDPRDIDYLLRSWIRNHLKPRTMRAALTVACKYIEFITGKRPDTRPVIMTINGMEMPSEVKVWTKEEATKALQACKEEIPQLYLPLLLTMHLGLRKGEAIGLRWSDVDFVKGLIKIQRSYEGPTKTGKPRTVPLSNKLALELEKWYTIGKDQYRVFQQMELNYHLDKLCKLAGVTRVTWHSLRHFFATQSLEAGVSPRIVQSMLGHSKLSTTLDLYWSEIKETPDLDFLP